MLFHVSGLQRVWRSCNGVGHVNRVKLHRARPLLGWVTFGGSTILTYLSRPLSLTVPLWVGAMSIYWRWLRPPPRKKRRVLRISEPYYQECWRKPKFHLARHVSTRLDTTRSTCRAYAFWLLRLSNSTARHTRHDERDRHKRLNLYRRAL